MKGNIGLTQDIIYNEITVKQNNKHNGLFGSSGSEIINYSNQTNKTYTEILPHKQLYEQTTLENNGIFSHKFILTNNTNKFLILKELYLMSDDLTTDEFVPLITKIIHEVKDKFVLNVFNGESLKAINLFSKYDNKYCLAIPLISSYSVMAYFENNPIVITVESHKQIQFKLLGIFNHVNFIWEINKFHGGVHEYLNTSFDLHKFDLQKGDMSFSFNYDENSLFYRSIILIIDAKYKNLHMSIDAINFNYEINLFNTQHKFIGNKIAFLITNSYNSHNEKLCDYQPQSIIEATSITVTVNNVPNICELFIICQQYNIIRLFC